MTMLTLPAKPRMLDRPLLVFRLLMAVSFPVFLFAQAVSRFDPRCWRSRQNERRPSIVAEAWTAAGTVAQFAFAG